MKQKKESRETTKFRKWQYLELGNAKNLENGQTNHLRFQPIIFTAKDQISAQQGRIPKCND